MRRVIKVTKSIQVLGISLLFLYLVSGLYSFGVISVSSEILFIPFVLVALGFFMFKFDSRFLILSAILYLWLAAFFLAYDYENTANNLAIFAYYFLVVGVLLQFIEFKLDYVLKIELESLKRVLFSPFMLYSGIVSLIVFVNARLLLGNILLEIVSLYLGITAIIIYFIRYLEYDTKDTVPA